MSHLDWRKYQQAMEPKQIDLYEFLVESELQQYYNSIKNELKISNASHLKYATDEDLKQIGLSRPEIRRLRKFYEKYYPHGYLSKIKRLLQNPNRKDDGLMSNQMASTEPTRVINSPSKAPSNKHIIPADSITVNKQLGTGEFGIVQQGVWTNGAERIQVAIKCLCRERMQSNPMEFLKEAAIMHAIEHENIVRLYGVVLDTDSLMLVTELAHLRSLLECLKDPGLRVSFLTVPTLCEFAMQICNGMMYLENKRLIHRDLAARNILVFSKNKVKISDFGLSRALGVGKDYYKTNFNVNLKLPIAWCAPECINYLRFTNASDVWAYGVCLWEMFSYGFQPWAALTGLQVLEAIDEPNYQRLEQPECCPREYYNLMLKCWQHEPNKRPKFTEIYSSLPDIKPEQLKTIVNNCESKKEHLIYRQGEIITVLDKGANTPYWKGVLNSGKTGFFNPANTVAYLEGLPSCTNRDSFCRTSDRSSKRKLRTEMISMPQNDLKHTGHVGIDGAYFGDVAFIASSQNYNHLPRQIVTPYKPSEDIEQTPLLLPPTPTSPDSLQTASGYFPEEITTSSTNPTFINSNENTPKHQTSAFGSFDFPPQPVFISSNPFASSAISSTSFAMQNNNYGLESNAFTNANLEDDSLQDCLQKNINWTENEPEAQHEYHEISDDEITADKVFDLGPSLLDEINSMFGSISTARAECSPKSPDFEHTNKKNEIAELTSKLNRKNSGSDTNGNKSKKKTAGTVKNISVKDEKILNQAIDFANEISARSMTDLVSDHNTTTQSPKRKFSFRFPNLSHHGSTEKDGTMNGNANSNSTTKEKRNFTEELKSIPDLQSSITEEGREAYNSLIERKSTSIIGKFDTNEFKLAAAKTLPRKLVNLGTCSKRLLEIESHYDQDLCAPSQQAPRPTTLPYRGTNKMKKSDISDPSPLRILRDKNFPIGRPRPKLLSNLEDENTNPQNNSTEVGDKDSMCESPSYMTNTSYTFPENKSINRKKLQGKSCNDSTDNPIPLPPRDRTKIMQINQKRHVRKHPLIIPAYGVQRTLNKVTEITPVDEQPQIPFPGTQSDQNLNHLSSNHNYNIKCNNENKDECTKVKKVTQEIISTLASACSKIYDSNCRTYENIEDIKINLNENNTDSASLHFESILEDDFNKVDVVSSPDVVDGFCPFAIQKEEYHKSKEVDFDSSKISGLYVNEDELRNLDLERKRDEFIQKHPKYLQPDNELANHALFNKVRENVDTAMNQTSQVEEKETNLEYESKEKDLNEEDDLQEEEMKFKDSNSVSCEDLLEFSDKKPKGCERGVDSDEVRIMQKVLGKDASPERCLSTLEFIEWDVHKAIKLIKLQNILSSVGLSLQESVGAFQKYDWDLQVTVLKLRGLK